MASPTDDRAVKEMSSLSSLQIRLEATLHEHANALRRAEELSKDVISIEKEIEDIVAEVHKLADDMVIELLDIDANISEALHIDIKLITDSLCATYEDKPSTDTKDN